MIKIFTRFIINYKVLIFFHAFTNAWDVLASQILFTMITSAKEVIFLPVFVCLSVCLFFFVNKITQKLVDGF